MKLRIISIGHKLPNWIQMGFDDYLKRTLPMITVQVVEIAPIKRSKNPSASEIEKCKTQEGQLILSARLPKEKLWVLEVTGKMLSTEKLAEKLSTVMQEAQDVALVIGGADGICKEVLAAADFKWSLSDLTLPHPLVKVILMEQLYRAMTIINHHPYHRSG